MSQHSRRDTPPTYLPSALPLVVQRDPAMPFFCTLWALMLSKAFEAGIHQKELCDKWAQLDKHWSRQGLCVEEQSYRAEKATWEFFFRGESYPIVWPGNAYSITTTKALADHVLHVVDKQAPRSLDHYAGDYYEGTRSAEEAAYIAELYPGVGSEGRVAPRLNETYSALINKCFKDKYPLTGTTGANEYDPLNPFLDPAASNAPRSRRSPGLEVGNAARYGLPKYTAIGDEILYGQMPQEMVTVSGAPPPREPRAMQDPRVTGHFCNKNLRCEWCNRCLNCCNCSQETTVASQGNMSSSYGNGGSMIAIASSNNSSSGGGADGGVRDRDYDNHDGGYRGSSDHYYDRPHTTNGGMGSRGSSNGGNTSVGGMGAGVVSSNNYGNSRRGGIGSRCGSNGGDTSFGGRDGSSINSNRGNSRGGGVRGPTINKGSITKGRRYGRK